MNVFVHKTGSASYNALRFRQTNTHWIYMPWYVFVLLAVQWIFKLNKSMLLLSIARGQFKNKDNDSKKHVKELKLKTSILLCLSGLDLKYEKKEAFYIYLSFPMRDKPEIITLHSYFIVAHLDNQKQFPTHWFHKHFLLLTASCIISAFAWENWF